MEGSCGADDDRLRITAQLVDAADGSHMWAERYDRDLADFFDLQDEITRRIAAAIEPEIFAIEGHNASRRNVTDLSVWEASRWWNNPAAAADASMSRFISSRGGGTTF